MKIKIAFILFFGCIQFSFCQNEKISSQVSAIFFGLDITKKPSTMEAESRRPIDYGETIIEQNKKEFTSHPILSGDIKGFYNTTYLYHVIYKTELFDNYGIYHLQMYVEFKNYTECRKAMDKLKRLFKNPAFRTYSEVDRGKDPMKEKFIYLIDEDLQLPRVNIEYRKGPYSITIDVYTSYDFKKFRNYKKALFDDY